MITLIYWKRTGTVATRIGLVPVSAIMAIIQVGEYMGEDVYLEYYFLGQKRFLRKMTNQKYIRDAVRSRCYFHKSHLLGCKILVADLDINKILKIAGTYIK